MSSARRPPLVMTVHSSAGVLSLRVPHKPRLTIGRADDNDIRIDDASVSRHHAALHVAETLSVEDLGSANGTRVLRAAISDRTTRQDDGRVAARARVEIRPGDSLAFGSTLLVLGERASKPRPASGGPEIVLADPRMRELYALVDRLAPAPINVLITGETGTGKELVAATVHARSPRAAGPFVRLNCAAIAESLLEAELFGHEKGAFTGAADARPGLVETADGGTLFLDEVGELSPAAQAKLLRVLEQREVVRVGGRAPREVDVRFVSATHRDLARRAAEGAFRQDLYFRLNGFTLAVPPLRDRTADIEPLARHFLERAARSHGRPIPSLTPEAALRLAAHRWPGNVRELKNVIDRALVLCAAGAVGPEHLVFDTTEAPPPPVASPQVVAEPRSLPEDLDAVERRRIEDALQRCGGNQTRAAEMLGISRRTLVYRLDKYGFARPRDR